MCDEAFKLNARVLCEKSLDTALCPLKKWVRVRDGDGVKRGDDIASGCWLWRSHETGLVKNESIYKRMLGVLDIT